MYFIPSSLCEYRALFLGNIPIATLTIEKERELVEAESQQTLLALQAQHATAFMTWQYKIVFHEGNFGTIYYDSSKAVDFSKWHVESPVIEFPNGAGIAKYRFLEFGIFSGKQTNRGLLQRRQEEEDEEEEDSDEPNFVMYLTPTVGTPHCAILDLGLIDNVNPNLRISWDVFEVEPEDYEECDDPKELCTEKTYVALETEMLTMLPQKIYLLYPSLSELEGESGHLLGDYVEEFFLSVYFLTPPTSVRLINMQSSEDGEEETEFF